MVAGACALQGLCRDRVQINETETPLHRLETVYRRLVEHLGTADMASGAFRSVIDGWFYALEQDVLADPSVDLTMRKGCCEGLDALMEARLSVISKTAPRSRRCCAPIGRPWPTTMACWPRA